MGNQPGFRPNQPLDVRRLQLPVGIAGMPGIFAALAVLPAKIVFGRAADDRRHGSCRAAGRLAEREHQRRIVGLSGAVYRLSCLAEAEGSRLDDLRPDRRTGGVCCVDPGTGQLQPCRRFCGQLPFSYQVRRAFFQLSEYAVGQRPAAAFGVCRALCAAVGAETGPHCTSLASDPAAGWAGRQLCHDPEPLLL